MLDSNFKEFIQSLNANGVNDFGFGTLGLTEKDFLDSANIVQIGQEPNRIDLILDLEGMDFEECFAIRQEVVFEGIPINFIDLDNLIKSKRLAGRRKDLADVDELKKQKKK